VGHLCPRAAVMNYANPMSPLTLPALRATRLSVVGLCHSAPAIASLAIFQLPWIWNHLPLAIILLSGNRVLTYQITNLIDLKGGNWHLLTAAALVSVVVPMVAFLAFQRYFARGLLAGS